MKRSVLACPVTAAAFAVFGEGVYVHDQTLPTHANPAHVCVAPSMETLTISESIAGRSMRRGFGHSPARRKVWNTHLRTDE